MFVSCVQYEQILRNTQKYQINGVDFAVFRVSGYSYLIWGTLEAKCHHRHTIDNIKRFVLFMVAPREDKGTKGKAQKETRRDYKDFKNKKVWLKNEATYIMIERSVNKFQNNNNIQSVFGAIITIVNEVWYLLLL